MNSCEEYRLTLAKFYVDRVFSQSPIVSTSHLTLRDCYRNMPESWHERFDTLVEQLIKERDYDQSGDS